MNKPKKSKRIRLTSEESRNRILEASLKLLFKHGWEETSFQMIADACKTSQSNVIFHFKNKRLLLQALIQKISLNNFRIVSEGLKPEHDAFERILNYFQKNLEWATEFPEEAQVIVLVYYDACHNKEFSEIFSRILKTAQGRMHEYVLAGVRENIFDLSLTPMQTSKILHNTAVGAFINVMGGRLTEPNQYTEKEWQIVVGNLVGYRNSRG